MLDPATHINMVSSFELSFLRWKQPSMKAIFCVSIYPIKSFLWWKNGSISYPKNHYHVTSWIEDLVALSGYFGWFKPSPQHFHLERFFERRLLTVPAKICLQQGTLELSLFILQCLLEGLLSDIPWRPVTAWHIVIIQMLFVFAWSNWWNVM